MERWYDYKTVFQKASCVLKDLFMCTPDILPLFADIRNPCPSLAVSMLEKIPCRIHFTVYTDAFPLYKFTITSLWNKHNVHTLNEKYLLNNTTGVVLLALEYVSYTPVATGVCYSELLPFVSVHCQTMCISFDPKSTQHDWNWHIRHFTDDVIHQIVRGYWCRD